MMRGLSRAHINWAVYGEPRRHDEWRRERVMVTTSRSGTRQERTRSPEMVLAGPMRATRTWTANLEEGYVETCEVDRY